MTLELKDTFNMKPSSPALFASLCGIFLWSVSLPLWSCPLNANLISQTFEQVEQLEQRSQLTGRCDYSWARKNQQELESQNAEQLRQGVQASQQLAPLWNRLVLEQYRRAENPNQAEVLFNQLISQGPPARFGSPDPLKGLAFKKLDRHSAWDESNKALLFVKGAQIYRLHLQVFGLDTDELKAKAQTLSKAVSQDTP